MGKTKIILKSNLVRGSVHVPIATMSNGDKDALMKGLNKRVVGQIGQQGRAATSGPWHLPQVTSPQNENDPIAKDAEFRYRNQAQYLSVQVDPKTSHHQTNPFARNDDDVN